MLETFMRRPGQVLSRDQLLEHAWDLRLRETSNVIDVYVRDPRERSTAVRAGLDQDRPRVGLRLCEERRREPHPDPRPADAAVCGCDGRGARRAWRVRLSPGGARRCCSRPIKLLLRAGDRGDVEAGQGQSRRPSTAETRRPGVSLAQVLDARGAVLISQPSGLAPLIEPWRGRGWSPRAGRSARRCRFQAGVGALAAARRVPGGKGNKVRGALVLGSSLDVPDESREGLRHGAALRRRLSPLLLATVAGYILAGAALRPVEAMRRKADAISAATPGSRLPVPPTRDEVSRLAETLNEMLARLEAAFDRSSRPVRRRGEPRAADAARSPPYRARACAAPAAVAGRARGGAPLCRRRRQTGSRRSPKTCC